MLEERRINNLYKYLKETKENEIEVRTTLVVGGWDDNHMDANLAGFNIYRTRNKEMEARREFSETYTIIRK